MKLWYELTTHKDTTAFGLVREDFNRRFAETHMLLKVKDEEEEPYYIEGLHTSGSLLSYKINGSKRSYPIEQIVSLRPWLPKSGYYQLKTQAIFVERRAVRQWKRSFNLNMYNIDMVECPILDLYDAWKGNQPSFSLNNIDEDSPPIKLTNELATGYKNNRMGLCILFETLPIAKINVRLKQIKIILPEFEQEIRDYLKKSQLTSWKIIK